MKNFKTLLLILTLTYSGGNLLACYGDWGGGWYSSGNLWAGWAWDGPYRRFNGPSNADVARCLPDETQYYESEIKLLEQDSKRIQRDKQLSSSEKERKITNNKNYIKEYKTYLAIINDPYNT